MLHLSWPRLESKKWEFQDKQRVVLKIKKFHWAREGNEERDSFTKAGGVEITERDVLPFEISEISYLAIDL